jgi:hypothetical protein
MARTISIQPTTFFSSTATQITSQNDTWKNLRLQLRSSVQLTVKILKGWYL